MTDVRQPQLSPVLIHLLKGVLYREAQPVVWDDLLRLQGEVMDYMKRIGLELHVNEAEGFAYIKQIAFENETDEDREGNMPRLIHRHRLSYPVSLLCVLLRKKMVEIDASGGETRLILSHEQIVEMMRTFLPGHSNEAFTQDKIETYIRKVQDFGFLRPLKSEPAYEVRRIIKALMDADWLVDLDEKLKAYAEYGNRAS